MNRTTLGVRWFVRLSALVAILLWQPWSSPAQTKDTGTLTVRVTGARNTKGKIGVTLFQDARGFPDDPSKAFRQQAVEIDPKTISGEVVFKDLPQGTFAASGFTMRTATGKWTRTL